jgi:hypothetical protein
MRAILALALSVLTVSGTAAAGQDEQDVFSRGFGMAGLTAPDNLAAGALGIGPDNISQIRSGSSLSSTLLSGIGPDGKLKGALGLGVSPYALGVWVDETQYRTDFWRRITARSSASIALSQGETEESDGSIAVGGQTVVFDRGDLLMRSARDSSGAQVPAVQRCTTLSAASDDELTMPQQPGETTGDVDPRLLSAYVACARKLERVAWNDASLGLGIVLVSRAEDSSIFDISRSNTVAYLTATYGFEGVDRSDELTISENGALSSGCDDGQFRLSCNAQVVFHFKYQSDGVYELPVTGMATGESTSFGVKLVGGTARSVGYAFYRKEEVEFDLGERRVTEYGLGFETRLPGKLWLNVSAGRRDDDILGEENTVKANLSWDILSASRFLNRFSD